MKRINKLIIIFLMIFPMIVSAKECSKNEEDIFNKMVNDIKIEHVHEKDNLFKIKMSNIPKELIVVDDKDNQFTYNSNKTVTVNGYEGGKTYKFNILPLYYDCELSLSFTRSVTLPTYNKYSEKKDCKKYKDFELCDEFYDGKITDKVFNEQLKKYKSENVNSKILFLCICGCNLMILTIAGIFILKNSKKHKSKKMMIK